MSDIVVNNASALMLDVGGVLSDLNSAKHDGDTIYKSALTGAYCFLQSFKRTYPGIPVHVISRVNRPADNHWVVRFCEALGAGASVHQVKHRHQKGEVARSLGITICVDDAYQGGLTGSFFDTGPIAYLNTFDVSISLGSGA